MPAFRQAPFHGAGRRFNGREEERLFAPSGSTPSDKSDGSQARSGSQSRFAGLSDKRVLVGVRFQRTREKDRLITPSDKSDG